MGILAHKHHKEAAVEGLVLAVGADRTHRSLHIQHRFPANERSMINAYYSNIGSLLLNAETKFFVNINQSAWPGVPHVRN